MRILVFTICMIAACLLQADTLSDLRVALKSLKAETPLSLHVERNSWERENGKDTSGQDSFDVEDGPKGFQQKDGKPLDGGDLTAKNLTRAHLSLLELIQNASVIDERSDLLDGQTVKKLRLSLLGNRETLPQKVKFKKFLMELTLWIGPDHLPLAMDIQAEVEGRAMLVMKFATKALDHRRFAKIKDRLVLLESSSEAQFKVMGKEGAARKLLHTKVQ